MAKINKIVLPDSNEYEINDYRISDADISTWNAGSSGGWAPILLWDNPNKSSNFNAGDVTSSSTGAVNPTSWQKDWSFLLVIYGLQASTSDTVISWLVPKGYTTRASIAWAGSNNNVFASRGTSFTYSSGTITVTFANGYIKNPGTITAGANYMIPYKIYGFV